MSEKGSQDWCCEGTTRQDTTGQDRTGQDSTGQDRIVQDSTGQEVKTGCKWKVSATVPERIPGVRVAATERGMG